MPKVKVSDASGPVLDWMVAGCEGWERGKYMMSPDIRKDAHGRVLGIKVPNNREYVWWKPSTDWAQGGPIVEREKIEVTPPVPDWCDGADDKDWMATSLPPTRGDATLEVGPTPLIAAMRCFVVSKLGEEVDVPKELT